MEGEEVSTTDNAMVDTAVAAGIAAGHAEVAADQAVEAVHTAETAVEIAVEAVRTVDQAFEAIFNAQVTIDALQLRVEALEASRATTETTSEVVSESPPSEEGATAETVVQPSPEVAVSNGRRYRRI